MTYDNYFSTKAFKQILEEFKQCEADGVPFIASSYDYADIILYYHQIGQTEKASEIFEKAMKLYPDALSLMTGRIRMVLTQGQVEEAWKLADQIKDKEDPEYSHIIAEIMIFEGKEEEANQYLEDWYQERKDEEYMEDYAMDTAWLLLDLGLPDLAWKWLDYVDDRDEEEYLELKANLLISAGKAEEAKKIINQLIDRDPYAIAYWNLLAYAQLKNGEIEDSITSSEYALAINPDDCEATYNKASALYSLGNIEEALHYFERYSKQLPLDSGSEFHQALCLCELDRFDEAFKHLEKVEQISENDYKDEVLFIKGFIFLQADRLDEAKKCFLESIKITDDEAMQSKEYAMLAYCALQQEDFDAFEKYMKKGSMFDPKGMNDLFSSFLPGDKRTDKE